MPELEDPKHATYSRDMTAVYLEKYTNLKTELLRMEQLFRVGPERDPRVLLEAIKMQVELALRKDARL